VITMTSPRFNPKRSPTSTGNSIALDFETSKVVLEVIERIHIAFGTTTAVMTHNAGIAAMADRVVTMRRGEIVQVHRNATRATPAELYW